MTIVCRWLIISKIQNKSLFCVKILMSIMVLLVTIHHTSLMPTSSSKNLMNNSGIVVFRINDHRFMWSRNVPSTMTTTRKSPKIVLIDWRKLDSLSSRLNDTEAIWTNFERLAVDSNRKTASFTTVGVKATMKSISVKPIKMVMLPWSEHEEKKVSTTHIS
jgi:hypothetical protein